MFGVIFMCYYMTVVCHVMLQENAYMSIIINFIQKKLYPKTYIYLQWQVCTHLLLVKSQPNSKQNPKSWLDNNIYHSGDHMLQLSNYLFRVEFGVTLTQRRPLRGAFPEDEHLSSMDKWCESLQLLPRVNLGDLARVKGICKCCTTFNF